MLVGRIRELWHGPRRFTALRTALAGSAGRCRRTVGAVSKRPGW
ncbi:hypothetical protein F8B43_0918 [Methylorubrum populi]|uniref:Uncharacterized protein n=1 Tax=Methylorubrum populi TaxID=223967 RepID=A0A833N270_9HYPH|nr:hypothetical protein F8B43_0918 [Methylorubrum populi]